MRSDIFTCGSFFSGIGGMDLGLEMTGRIKVKYFVEKDPYAQLILKKHWPGVPIYDDVISLRTDRLPKVDIVAGGPPCQDFSYSGKQKGIKGPQGVLSITYWEKISEIRPKYVIMENVPGIADEGLLRVLSEAAACGYDAEWNTISACAAGAFHRRDRIFLIGIRRDISCRYDRRCILGSDEINTADRGGKTQSHPLQSSSEKVRLFPTPMSRDGNRGGGRGSHSHSLKKRYLEGVVEDMANSRCRPCRRGDSDDGCLEYYTQQGQKDIGMQCPERNRNGSIGRNPIKWRNEIGRIFIEPPEFHAFWNEIECGLDRITDGLSCGMDEIANWERGIPKVTPHTWDRRHRIRCIGNAVVPQVAEYVGRCIIEFDRKVRGV